MQQKSKKSDLVTKVFLKKELKKFENAFDQKLTAMDIKTDIKLERLERRIDDNAQKYRDQVLTSNDKLAKTLETMRQENSIGFNQINRQLDGHETRIQKLEQIQQPA
ncbi:MAG: hypothetical protein AAB583_00725 [Patescibacteria group bacterium]